MTRIKLKSYNPNEILNKFLRPALLCFYLYLNYKYVGLVNAQHQIL